MELRAQASWLLAKQVVSGPVLLDAAASEPWAVAVVWLKVAPQQAAVSEVDPVWAAWAVAELARLAEAKPALAVVVPSLGPVAVWSVRPRESARALAAVQACTAAEAERRLA